MSKTGLVQDKVVVVTGAGGGITAEICARAGLKVLLIEEGPLKTSKDFKMVESAGIEPASANTLQQVLHT